MNRTFILAVGFASSLFAACATDSGRSYGDDELGSESSADGEEAKADGADNFRYVTVHAFNNRRTHTSGYTLTRANRTTMKCADGTY